MTKISGSTVYFKIIFPSFWFGFLALFILVGVISGAPLLFIVGPLVMAVFGFFFFRRFVWDLADEVYDGGDYLVFRKGDVEQRVNLDEIININSQRSSPERITVSVRSPGPLGRELTFNPPYRFGFGTSPIVIDLIERVDQARRSR